MKGIKRFRQAIKNQRDLGNGDFSLTYHDAEQIAAETEKEFESLSWAVGVPVPRDADGEVVPLTTKVMYTNRGQKIELREFYLLHSVLRGGFVWRAIHHVGNSVEDLKLDFLHLRRPDSWERLEEDVEQFEDGGTACEYFGSELTSCNECKSPCSIGANCRDGVARDVLRRAKALAERDAKEASRG